MRFVLIQVLLLLAFAQVIVALPLDMRAHGLGTAQIGWLLGLNGVFIVIAQPIALRSCAASATCSGSSRARADGPRPRRDGVRGTARSCTRSSAALWTLGEIGFSTAAPALVADFAPVAQRGAYQGTYQLAWAVASILAPTLGTLVLARLGAHALWAGCLAVCLAAAALHLRVTGRRRLS